MIANHIFMKVAAASLIALLFMFSGINSECNAQNSSQGKQLILESSIDTCTFVEDMFDVNAALKCKGLLPRMVYSNKCISENVVGQSVNDGELFLIVKHNGHIYRYFESVILYKHGLANNHLLLPLCSIKCDMKFYMKSFHPETGQNALSEPNKDFGLYSITAVYVDKSNDTIYSNPISIWYIEQGISNGIKAN